VSRRFREIQRSIQADPELADARLLTVTLDPQHDTPAVLREYAVAMGADFTRWRFATGPTEQVAALTRAFGIHTQPSGGSIDHTLATSLFDRNGQVVEIWRGQSWKAQEIVEAVKRVTASIE
jgi:protein SCO1/2